ncbi:HAD family hydrolase [Streptomyces sp. TS71-3]|uniref:HAD family hydrolase n=1 Tax=Streptomyces sp. TS71-3 TaxID=2733862 RepID=UPI001B17C63F|nr:HAD-IA family hydrolase [Streptomyces sp. TS71-3]GHJ34425.1 hypothetical protein Sm713_00340 [Streptomyces sp. TS71-3]
MRNGSNRHRGSDLVGELEERLTQAELAAVDSAWPTEYADPLIHTWRSAGARLAMATNNSPRIAHAYLSGRDLGRVRHIYGRTEDLQRLKPDPYCLLRALNATGTRPGAALMIGDNPSDLAAARQAGVAFLGYAANDRKAKLLREAGAEAVVTSLWEVLVLVREGAEPSGPPLSGPPLSGPSVAPGMWKLDVTTRV